MAQFVVTGVEARPMTERMPAWPVYDIFDTSDGQLFVGVVTDTQWRVFCEAFGLASDILADPDACDPAPTCRRDASARLPRGCRGVALATRAPN